MLADMALPRSGLLEQSVEPERHHRTAGGTLATLGGPTFMAGNDMPLIKNKKWMAYTVALNDMI